MCCDFREWRSKLSLIGSTSLKKRPDYNDVSDIFTIKSTNETKQITKCMVTRRIPKQKRAEVRFRWERVPVRSRSPGGRTYWGIW